MQPAAQLRALTSCDRNPNIAGGQWAMAHLACGFKWGAQERAKWLPALLDKPAAAPSPLAPTDEAEAA